MQQAIESQQACRISQHALSPLMQVMQQPFSVYSQVQMPQARLCWQMVIPFSVQQQLQRLPASILHRFCSVPQATSSSQMQLSLKPPLHFSAVISQRGTTHQLAPGVKPG